MEFNHGFLKNYVGLSVSYRPDVSYLAGYYWWIILKVPFHYFEISK